MGKRSIKKLLNNSEITAIQAISKCKLELNQECGTFYHAQEFINRDMFGWRILSSWSYWIGFALIGYVFYENIWFVLQNHLFNT